MATHKIYILLHTVSFRTGKNSSRTYTNAASKGEEIAPVRYIERVDQKERVCDRGCRKEGRGMNGWDGKEGGKGEREKERGLKQRQTDGLTDGGSPTNGLSANC